jgi:ADP-ribose pyrophosphatase
MKSRTERPDLYPKRFLVPINKIPWMIRFPQYDPPYYVAPVVLTQDCTKITNGWADPEDLTKITRTFRSYIGPVKFDIERRPLNPMGRTGIAGRGLLGAWGANFAADPIVTRINPKTQLLEMTAIQRRDTLEMAIPGGMVDHGEAISQTLSREFQEEAGACLDMSEAKLIFRGYVDDPRSTDHAWIETTAMHLHLSPQLANTIELQAGDDARAVTWLKISKENLGKLYANHRDFVIMALRKMFSDNIILPRPTLDELSKIF